jgi:hypothetical protein
MKNWLGRLHIASEVERSFEFDKWGLTGESIWKPGRETPSAMENVLTVTSRTPVGGV